MSKVYHKAIPLLPTKWDLEVFVCKDYKQLNKKAAEVLGETEEFWDENIGMHPCVLSYEGPKQHYICMFLPNFKPGVVVHEAVHVTWYLDKWVNFRYRYNNQEVQAYLTEYIFEQIMLMKCQ